MTSGKASCFADTNLLVYTVDPAEPEKRQRAKDFLTRIINRHTLVLSPQSLNECYRVTAEKRGLMPKNEARLLVWAWSEFCTAPYDFDVTQQAWKIQDQHGFNWWDCMLLASASRARCDLFLSEDMRHEQSVAGLTILNPFKLAPNFDFSR
jgi:predicted nucleic acid-binding protein